MTEHFFKKSEPSAATRQPGRACAQRQLAQRGLLGLTVLLKPEQMINYLVLMLDRSEYNSEKEMINNVPGKFMPTFKTDQVKPPLLQENDNEPAVC